jgi:mannose-1-phosphate guanylyltransferase
LKKVALIMAGGMGERFWPKSRKNMPKQFLPLTGESKTMIQLTWDRILPIIDKDDIYVVTNQDYKVLVREQLPEILEENILCEPLGRNTAPCIGLGAVHMAKKYGDAIMVVLPADHFIQYNSMFLQTVTDACLVAEENDNLVTIGITANTPETGYGYIEFRSDYNKGRALSVVRFVEKPDKETAKKYIAAKRYLWNSGTFIWKISSILKNFQELMPEMYEGLQKIQTAIGSNRYQSMLEREYYTFKSESVDYGIMEKADNIFTVPGTFGWDDVGSWLAVERFNQTNESGNIIDGKFITIDTKNCILQGTDKLIATIGVNDLVVVDTGDALLICQKDKVGSIKKVLETLRITNQTQYI